MAIAVTVRDVPQDVRDELAARAARRGQSLQDYLRTKLIADASRPSVEDVIERVRRRVEVTGTRIDALTILEYRDLDRK